MSFGRSHLAFQSSDFTLFQWARGSRVIATEMISVAVGWQLYNLTSRPAVLGYTGLWQFLRGILLFLLAGHCADRFTRRNTLCNRISLDAIYFLLAVAGVARALRDPRLRRSSHNWCIGIISRMPSPGDR
jgi:hypothetical protein